MNDFRAPGTAKIHEHPILAHNAYCEWFSSGNVPLDELRRFTVQFSVFSHLFLEAQLRKCLNAPDLPSYRASKDILLNELGVAQCSVGHFEWLVEFGLAIGLDFEHLGRRYFATPTTLSFCDTLIDVYGNPDPATAGGASYALEHWAAAGFWHSIIQGLRHIRRSRIPKLPLGYWVWHGHLDARRVEATEAALFRFSHGTRDEQERFLAAGVTVLDAVQTFWDGLNEDREALLACG